MIVYIILLISSNTALAIKNYDIWYPYFNNKFNIIMAHRMPPCALNTVWVVSLNTTPPQEMHIALPAAHGQWGTWETEGSVPYVEAPTVELASMPSTLTPKLTLIILRHSMEFLRMKSSKGLSEKIAPEPRSTSQHQKTWLQENSIFPSLRPNSVYIIEYHIMYNRI